MKSEVLQHKSLTETAKGRGEGGCWAEASPPQCLPLLPAPGGGRGTWQVAAWSSIMMPAMPWPNPKSPLAPTAHPDPHPAGTARDSPPQPTHSMEGGGQRERGRKGDS
jgi:hypothetical protein